MSPKGDGQAENKQFGARVRTRAATVGKTQAGLAEELGLTRGTFGRYWNGDRIPPAPILFPLADLLQTDARYLVQGVREPNRTHVLDAVNADWIQVPTFDLANITDGDKGEVVKTTPMRLDWLKSTIGASSGLWVASVPCDYPALDLIEGDKVLCRDITVPELHDRHLCIWREADTGRMFIGRYSVVRPESVYIDPAGEYWVGKINVSLADPPPTIFPIGRIVGRPITRIR